jgi:hypothetical protein
VHFTFERMGNLPTLSLNATPLVSKFFGELLKKRQFKSNGIGVNLEKFKIVFDFCKIYVIVSNNYARISGKMSVTIEDK